MIAPSDGKQDGSPKRDSEGKKKETPRSPQFDWRFVLWYLPLTLLVLWIWQDVFSSIAVKTIDYSDFKHYLAQGEVVQCNISTDEIVGKIDTKPPAAASESASKSESKPAAPQAKSASKPTDQSKPAAPSGSPAAPSSPTAAPTNFLFRTVRVNAPDLTKELLAQHVTFGGVRSGLLSQVLYAWLLPIGIMLLVWMFLSRGLRSAGEAVMSFGKSRARLVADKDTGVRFADVAGCDEAKFELSEVVDFLKNPDHYSALGAKIPKGVLLVGLPGTGKTLLAKAVAGEAGAPFFSLSGSDFVEMFVGVGAARVRDLFEQAKRQAPSIVFIDELDAIGRERAIRVGAVNDEREQTLNQLLVEMDGFAPNAGVIILAATNRPEVLDRALLRPGRFDRQVVLDLPDLDGREAILKVHARGKPLAEGTDLRKLARETPGFTGADLANALNEAALLAARHGARQIAQKDLQEAVEKVLAGPERKSRRLQEEERRRVAYHETGHALVAAYSEHVDPVHKISIVPRGRAALGYTLQLPVGEQFLMTETELLERIRGLLGGRAAEELIFGVVSTGAENDLEQANVLARRMVCLYGMSEAVGLIHAGSRPAMYLPGAEPVAAENLSSQTARDVDNEVKKILDNAYRAAKQILADHREQLETVARELIRRETIDETEFMQLLGRAAPVAK